MIEELLDVGWALAAEFVDFVGVEVRRRTLGDWVLRFFPLVLFLELPRYYLSTVVLCVARLLRLPRIDHASRAALLGRRPLVSVVVAGRNESAVIQRTIACLLDQDYPNLEILVVDDASEDEMPELARPFARKGLIRFVRNDGSRGRGGKPTGANLGLRLSRGEFVVLLDADTTFDRSMIRKMIAHFAEPDVGAVAGNVLVLNRDENLLSRLQTIEYSIGIDIHKRFSDVIGCALQGSGAITAFRRAPLVALGGWDPELAEDTDISFRMVRAGWRIAFAAEAVALTEVPTRWGVIARQRARWDRGGLRIFLGIGRPLLNPKRSHLGFAFELWSLYLFYIFATVAYPFYLLWLLLQGGFVFAFVLLVSAVVYSILSLLTLVSIRMHSERVDHVGRLLGAALFMPYYKEFLRWVRFKAFVKEFFVIAPDDPFLPGNAWANGRRF